MDDKSKNTPAAEEKPAPAKPEAVADKKAAEATPDKKGETIGDALDTNPPKESKKEEMVPLSKFLEVKNESKALAKEMKELRESIESGATKKEVAADIKAIAEKYDVKVDFLEELANAVRAKTASEVDERMDTRLKPIEEKDRAKKINKAFNEHFTKAMADMPEYDGVVKKEVIKSLSLDPANAKKTFTQLIEETYGHLVTGKRTIDTASTRAGKDDSVEVDMSRAKRDSAYFKEIMANPVLKKKYNDSLIGSISSHL